MRIYLAHSRLFDFKGELYLPLKSAIGSDHTLILPHENSSEPYPSRKLFESHNCDLVLAEVSWPSIGLGIELGWATSNNIPVCALGRSDKSISGSVREVCGALLIYRDSEDLVRQILTYISKVKN